METITNGFRTFVKRSIVREERVAKILILGEAGSIWTERCLQRSGTCQDNRIVLYTASDALHEEFYVQNRIPVVRTKKNTGIMSKVPKIRTVGMVTDYISGIKAIVQENGDFDIVHVSFLQREKMWSLKYLRKHTSKIVCTFWGSDLFREKESRLKEYAFFFPYADAITFSTEEMKERFQYTYGHRFDDKLCRLRFGVSALEQIATDEAKIKEAKSFCHIPSDKCCITVGYNGAAAQQHLRIIEALKETIIRYRDRICLLIPFTYGGDSIYQKEIENVLQACGCDYRIIDRYMNDRDLGMLRMATDMFIHGQMTDALSASVQEYLYAGKLVFSPAWIPYRELKQAGIYYIEYSSFEDLGMRVGHYLEQGPDPLEREQLFSNSQKIWKLSSWESVSDGWKKLYSLQR